MSSSAFKHQIVGYLNGNSIKVTSMMTDLWVLCRLCKLLTSPVTEIKDLVAHFLFILCKENGQ